MTVPNQEVEAFKQVLSGITLENQARLKRYGKSFIIRTIPDLDGVAWDLLEEAKIPDDKLLLVYSYNTNNCRLEIDVFRIDEADLRHLMTDGYKRDRQITQQLKQCDQALHLFCLFFVPDEASQTEDPEELEPIRKLYPFKYFTFFTRFMGKFGKGVRILCNLTEASQVLRTFGWSNVTTRETKFSVIPL